MISGACRASTPDTLSATLARYGISLRPQKPEDQPFLRQLYFETRWIELEPTGWPDETRAAFLNSQFDLQTRHYTTYYKDAAFDIVERGEQPVGRLYLYRTAREIRVVDISLLGAERRRGLGTRLLAAVGAEAAETGRIVSLHVEQSNPARQLYDRFGFRQVSENGPYCLMEWEPAIAHAS